MVDRITRSNLHQLAPYDQIQWRRQRRAEAEQMQAQVSSLANRFASVNIAYAQGQGDLYSKIAVNRIYKKA